ncbi:MAG: CocE/NonD family hydrolase [Ruminococcaceae bacterium]|nr:CocE/NonD family hydrolase [Oscillospiraceae bacterium]
MENFHCYYEYIKADGAKLFTVICAPNKVGKFPVTIYRTPYCDYEKDVSDEQSVENWLKDHQGRLKAGYVSIYQNCRGTGKSTGDCIPYVNERKDGLLLLDWIRKQPFYNGEIYLSGGSYCCTVNYSCAPFADDIKGAVFQIQDCNFHRHYFLNGFLQMGGRYNWYVDMYKKNLNIKKSFSSDLLKTLPLKDVMNKALGEESDSFNSKLMHPDINDEYWQTHPYARPYSTDVPKTTKFPVLFMTGMYDFYVGGMLSMWEELSEEVRSKSAFIIHPYAHRIAGKDTFYDFPDSDVNEVFPDVVGKWFAYVRGLSKAPVETGKITYYNMFGDGWRTDDFKAETPITFTLGNGERSYDYDPLSPASFKGGLSHNFGGTDWQDKPNQRDDIITVYTDKFKEDTFIKGKMKAKLKVKSNCDDTCFYMRISLCKAEGDWGLRDDITKISNFTDHYKKNSEITVDFTFDPIAFTVKKGEKLRIDISSSCFPNFSLHTNQKAHYALADNPVIAHNTVILSDSELTVFTKREN